MSAPYVEGPSPKPSNQADGVGPRKRRKRAPAAGAAADCFTCLSRSLKCDRRRPYCSQCLDEGKDCSGYKTQLTWGVGVASRGKLRGLSLPVVGTQKVAGQLWPSKAKKRQMGRISQDSLSNEANTAADPSLLSPDSTRSTSTFQFDPRIVSPLPIPYLTTSWPSSSLLQSSEVTLQDEIKSEMPETSFQMQSANMSLSSPHDRRTFHALHKSSTSFGNHERTSQLSQSATSNEISYYGPTMKASGLAISHSLPKFSVAPQLSSSFDTSFSSHQTYSTYPRPDESFVRNNDFDSPLSYGFQASAAGLEHTPSRMRQQPEDAIEEVQRHEYDGDCAILDDSSIGSGPFSMDYRLTISPFAAAAGIGKTPRMQYLINYYTEVISPVIVAFDGPNNPYRTQILRLAADSDVLQHAISALAASNLRQRRETGTLSTGKTDPARRSSMAHLSLTDESWHHQLILSPQEQAREETYHKGFAIQSLNQQLANPVLRKQDSILATLLVLCLFHICDSGVAKFQTQFAGVKKLLSLRGDELQLNSPETKWFTRMFTWFDAMTASVNDREGQLQGHHLDISALSDEEWALENLAGCDGQLFKTIAQLGRLNVLSQGKTVESNPTIVSSPLPTISFATSDYGNFDGNGWMRIIADDDLFSAKTADSDIQTQFWREWREIRQTLQTWQLDQSRFDATNPNAPFLTQEQRLDLANISESFRYSALLYTERLANPTAASTDANIQAWVRQSLNFIEQVKSDVYLLWPLFITGSECVDDRDRSIIRERCLDIQKDSGFLNNKSCLELLEKVWIANPGGHRSSPNAEQLSGFRFSEVMKLEGNKGEYIVV